MSDRSPIIGSTYPEHEKMAAVKEQSQAIGEFIEWLGMQGYHIASYVDEGFIQKRLAPTGKSITQLLAEHFDIDLRVIENEKRQMLEAIRARS